MSEHPSAASPTSIREVEEYKGLLSWVSSVDHKQIGILYLLASLFFFLFGLSEAAPCAFNWRALKITSFLPSNTIRFSPCTGPP